MRPNNKSWTQGNVNKAAEEYALTFQMGADGEAVSGIFLTYACARYIFVVQKSITFFIFFIFTYLRAVFLLVLLPDVISIKYTFLNTSFQQYFMPLTLRG